MTSNGSNLNKNKNRLQVWGYCDIFIGFIAFALQMVLYCLNDVDLIVYISIGFWGGLLFSVTGIGIVMKKKKKTIRNIAICSLTTSLLVIIIFVYGLAINILYINDCSRFCIKRVIEIAFLVIGFLAMITNSIVINRSKKRKHIPTTFVDPNSPPPRRIYTVNLMGLSSLQQENAVERMAEFWSEEPPPPYQELYEVILPPAYSANSN